MTTPVQILEKLEAMDAELFIFRSFGRVGQPLPTDTITIVGVGGNPSDYPVVNDVLFPKLEQIHADGLALINADPPPDEFPDFYALIETALVESAPPPGIDGYLARLESRVSELEATVAACCGPKEGANNG